jgi:miniconductance mechanosensitive channel
MEESGVRRIRRAIFIDMRSISFLDAELKRKFSVYPVLKEYIEKVEKTVTTSNSTDPESPFFNSTRLTNLGLFRFYAETYLKQHPLIDPKEPVILRHRDPEGNGLPLQVYVFTKNNQMTLYENVQSEIFEHILAIIGEFGLKVYQQPTGDDLLSLSNKNETMIN